MSAPHPVTTRERMISKQSTREEDNPYETWFAPCTRRNTLTWVFCGRPWRQREDGLQPSDGFHQVPHLLLGEGPDHRPLLCNAHPTGSRQAASIQGLATEHHELFGNRV